MNSLSIKLNGNFTFSWFMLGLKFLSKRNEFINVSGLGNVFIAKNLISYY